MFHTYDTTTPQLDQHIIDAITSNTTLSEPYYVYDEQAIIKQITSLKKRTGTGGVRIRYAMKANPTKAILSLMHEHNIHIDACSEHEVWRAIHAGIPAEHIQLTGQIMPKDLVKIIESGAHFCSCSLHQLETYGKLLPNTSVGIRLNPGVGSGQFPGVNVGGVLSSFGIWHEHIQKIQDICKKYNLTITTLHTHIGSGADPDIRKNVAEISLSYVKEFPDVHTLNIGGGLKVARMLDEISANSDNIGNNVITSFENFTSETGRELQLEIEPGTFFLANAGYLISKVDDIVDTGSLGHTFVKLRIGMSEIIRPIMYGARHPLRIQESNKADSAKEYIVVGHSCESSDMLTVDNKGVPLKRLFGNVEIGSLCVIGGAGAYCSSMSTKHYNSYPNIGEYLLTSEGSLVCIKKEEVLEDIRKQEI